MKRITLRACRHFIPVEPVKHYIEIKNEVRRLQLLDFGAGWTVAASGQCLRSRVNLRLLARSASGDDAYDSSGAASGDEARAASGSEAPAAAGDAVRAASEGSVGNAPPRKALRVDPW